jgi:hypothetical protein
MPTLKLVSLTLKSELVGLLICSTYFHTFQFSHILVYPQKTKDELAASSIETLMRDPAVKNVLGTTKKVEKGESSSLYRTLQLYVDSKEKSTETKKKKEKEKGEKKQMEFWPLIKVVRIYTKANALSTGAIIVDLPGVHDSNAARAAVAAGYLKQCTGLWIVAPIGRAVDDKSAKTLLGESFKRQLKFDGIYSRVTFICSKTDDISITEAADSLGLEDEMSADWEKMDALDEEIAALKQKKKDLEESKAMFWELMNDADDAVEIWDVRIYCLALFGSIADCLPMLGSPKGKVANRNLRRN